MFDKLSEVYFNFWDKLGVTNEFAIIIFLFFISYLLIKNAVKNGILNAYNQIKEDTKSTKTINFSKSFFINDDSKDK